MITKCHYWVDGVGGLDFEYGSEYSLDDHLVRRYDAAKVEYLEALRALRAQMDDPKRLVNLHDRNS